MAKAQKKGYTVKCEFHMGYMPKDYKEGANWSIDTDRFVGDSSCLNELKNCHAYAIVDMEIPLQHKTLDQITEIVNQLKVDEDVYHAVTAMRGAQLALAPYSVLEDRKTPINLRNDTWELKVEKNKLRYRIGVGGWLTNKESHLESALLDAIESIMNKGGVKVELRTNFSTTYYLKKREGNIKYRDNEFVAHRREQIKLLQNG